MSSKFSCGLARCLIAGLLLAGLPVMSFAQDGPDLQVTVGLVSPTTLASGDDISIAVQVFNIGNQPSSATSLDFYVSEDSTIATSDNVIDSSALGSLAAGSGFATNGSGAVNEAPGAYWVGACVAGDPADVNPANDCSAGVEIRIPDIDLATLPVTLSATTFPSGQSITFNTAVDNRGSETTEPSTLRYKLSNNSAISSGDTDITTAAIPALEGGERWLNQAQAVVQAAAGTWWIGACADVLTGESARTNNCSSGTQVTILSGSLPDLVVSEVIAIPDGWNPGEFIDFFAQVSNQGEAASAATSVNFYISGDATISTADDYLGTDSVAALNAGQSVDTGVFVDPGLAPGNYWFGACVVPDGVEFITDNNCSAAAAVTVTQNTNACVNLPISCGGVVASDLSSSDCDDSPRGTGYYAKRHTFTGSAGDDVVINADFSSDGYLYLQNPSGTVVAENDDFASATNSRIEYALNQAGTWTIWTTTNETAQSMSFELSLGCAGAPEPDLTVEIEQVSPLTIDPAEPISIDAMVSNIGGLAAAATTLRYRLSTDAVISPLDAELGADAVASLGAGANVLLSAEVQGPAVPGIYWVGACVAGVTGEANTDNNCSNAVQISVNENSNVCVDLAIACGETLAGSFDNTDCDDSPRGAGHFARSYSFSGSSGDTVIIDADWSGDGYLYLANPAGVAVAQNDDGNSETSSSLVHNLDVSGSWRIWTTSADTGAALSFDLSLNCEQSAQPDLVVSAPAVAPEDINFGQSIELSATVLNQGAGTSGSTGLRFMASSDATISPLDTVLRTSPVSSLAPSAQSLESVSLYLLLDEGTHWLGACVDPVAGELDSGNNCSAGVEITVGAGETIPFVPELNDGWYDPATNGQGFFINVFPDIEEIFLSWFTYELERPGDSVSANLGEPGHRWLTAQGSYTNDRATLDIYVAEGGIFNQSPPQPMLTPDGQIQLLFNSCGVGIVSYTIESLDLQGEVVIQRLAPDNIARCEAELAARAQASAGGIEATRTPSPPAPEQDGEFHINPGLNDAWFFPGTNGQGFFINVFPDSGQLFLSWFTYDTERPDESITAQIGEPGHRWLTAQGPFAGNVATLDVNIAEGGVFDASPPVPVLREDGTIVVEFSDCNTGLVTFDIPSINQSGEVPIQRLTLDNVGLCEELSAATAGSSE